VSVAIPCETDSVPSFIDETATVGLLSYKDERGRYEYAWKSDPAWRGTCRQLVLRLNDGSVHLANFFFAEARDEVQIVPCTLGELDREVPQRLVGATRQMLG